MSEFLSGALNTVRSVPTNPAPDQITTQVVFLAQ